MPTDKPDVAALTATALGLVESLECRVDHGEITPCCAKAEEVSSTKGAIRRALRAVEVRMRERASMALSGNEDWTKAIRALPLETEEP